MAAILFSCKCVWILLACFKNDIIHVTFTAHIMNTLKVLLHTTWDKHFMDFKSTLDRGLLARFYNTVLQKSSLFGKFDTVCSQAHEISDIFIKVYHFTTLLSPWSFIPRLLISRFVQPIVVYLCKPTFHRICMIKQEQSSVLWKKSYHDNQELGENAVFEIKLSCIPIAKNVFVRQHS